MIYDAKIYKPINSSQHHTEIDVDLDAMGKKWHLSINFSKCSAIRFSSCISQRHMNYKIDQNDITVVESQKDFGVVVSCDLSWNIQCTQAYNALHVIRRSTINLSIISLKQQLFTSLVKSQLSYCSQLWSQYFS